MARKIRDIIVSSKTGNIPRSEIKSVIKAVHVVPHSSGGWEVKKGGQHRVSSRFNTKGEAVQCARDIIRNINGEMVVHHRDGKIQWDNAHRDKHRTDRNTALTKS